MLMIRLQRTGRRNDAAFRIAVLEKARAARAGRIVEALGSYNPKTKAFAVDETRAKEWMAHGAQPTGTLKNLFITKGVMAGKKEDVFPASARKKAAEAAKKAAVEAAAAQKAEAEAAAAAAAAPATEAAEPEVAAQAEETPMAAPAPEEVPAVETPAAEVPVESEPAPAASEEQQPAA